MAGRVIQPKKKRPLKYDMLLGIIGAANDRLDPSGVIASIMDNIQTLIPCDAWSILLLNKEQDELIFEGARGKAAHNILSARLKIGEGIAGWVGRHRTPLIANDAAADSRFNSKFDQLNDFKTKSILCAPLISREQLIGVVELINRKSRNGRFTRRDLENLTTLLRPLAVSLHNALLFKETQKLAVTDDLTRLYNNRFINQRITELIHQYREQADRFSVIFLDLDGFKTVNDRFGHLVGGRTLVETGNVISQSVRKQDIVARYGGDEFVVILPQAGADEALQTAEQIRQAILEHDFQKSIGRDIRLSASFGISVFPDHAGSLTELIQKADHAMYAVKYSGKNAVQLADYTTHDDTTDAIDAMTQ